MTTISIVYSSLYSDIKRHLSIIGKRERDKQGKNIFSAITLSSAEDDILGSYLQSGANSIISALSQLLSMCSITQSTATAILRGTRSDHVSTGIQRGVRDYCIYFTVAEYLAMDFPELAKKYYDLAERTKGDVFVLAFSKQPPTSSGADPSGGGDSGGGDSGTVSTTIAATQDGESVWGFDVPAATILSMYLLHDNLTASVGSSVTLRIKSGSDVVSIGINLPYSFTPSLIEKIEDDYSEATLRFTPPMDQDGSITSSSVLTLTTSNN